MTEALPKEKETKKEKKAFGIFPRIPLSKSLELVQAIFDLGEGEPVRRRTVFDRLGKSPESGASRVLVVAANSGYGLTSGGNQAEYLGITDRGKQIVAAKSVGSKFEAIYEALFSNEIFSSFISRFNDRSVPIDEVAIEYLRNTHGLSLEDAQACWSVFKDNLNEQNLTQELSGKRVVISRDVALATYGISSVKKTDDAGEAQLKKMKQGETDAPSEMSHSRKHDGQQGTIVPQFHFNIQVVIPENASSETYDNIFRSIATHLLGRNEA